MNSSSAPARVPDPRGEARPDDHQHVDVRLELADRFPRRLQPVDRAERQTDPDERAPRRVKSRGEPPELVAHERLEREPGQERHASGEGDRHLPFIGGQSGERAAHETVHRSSVSRGSGRLG